MSYAKLHREILDSTIWLEDLHIKVVWVTMLAMRDNRNEVQASIPNLARRAGVTVEQCKEAIEKFKSPDPYSRSQDFEGRRIEDVRGGWKLLNGAYYQKRRSAEEKRAYDKLYRDKERLENRLKELENSNDSKGVVNSRKNRFASESRAEEKRREEKSRVEKSKELSASNKLSGNNKHSASSTLSRNVYDDLFDEFWKAYPKRRNKLEAKKRFKSLKPTRKLLDEMLKAIAQQKNSRQWLKDGGDYIPYPQKWLREGGWQSEVETLQESAFNRERAKYQESQGAFDIAESMVLNDSKSKT